MAFIIKHAGTVTDTLQCTALSLNKQPFGLIIARIFAKAARRTVSPDTFIQIGLGKIGRNSHIPCIKGLLRTFKNGSDIMAVVQMPTRSEQP